MGDLMLSRLGLAIAATLLLVMSVAALRAAELTASDYDYLHSRYGLAQDSDVLKNMASPERRRLHEIIYNFRQDPASRDEMVRGELYESYERQCDAWALGHNGQRCALAPDKTVAAGQQVADRNCNLCHRFGRSMSPSFFQLAQKRRWDEKDVRLALSHTHNMVPLTLPETEYGDLAAYINSFRQAE
jgi:hypothetical protein